MTFKQSHLYLINIVEIQIVLHLADKQLIQVGYQSIMPDEEFVLYFTKTIIRILTV